MLRLAGCKIENCDGHTAAYELLARLWQEETGRDLPAIAYTERGILLSRSRTDLRLQHMSIHDR